MAPTLTAVPTTLQKPTFEYMIEGRKVFAFDNVVSRDDIRAMSEAISHAPYVRTGFSTPWTKDVKYYSNLYPLEEVKSLPLYDLILRYKAKYFPERNAELHRAYVNNNGFGDVPSMHTDTVWEGGVTAVYYVNAKWHVTWGGETIFFKGMDEAVACVTPKPGRLALFDPLIWHRGSAPLRTTYESRMVFVFKFECADPNPRLVVDEAEAARILTNGA